MRRSLIAACAAAALLAACKREERQTRLDPAVIIALDQLEMMPNGINGRPPEVLMAMGIPYRGNAYQISQGKRQFMWMGCESCHREGQGGDRAPSLIDGWWNYGADLLTIYVSIRDGRPGGMPAYRDRLTPEQMWQLAGYVQAMGNYVGGAELSSRADRPQTRRGESRTPAEYEPK